MKSFFALFLLKVICAEDLLIFREVSSIQDDNLCVHAVIAGQRVLVVSQQPEDGLVLAAYTPESKEYLILEQTLTVFADDKNVWRDDVEHLLAGFVGKNLMVFPSYVYRMVVEVDIDQSEAFINALPFNTEIVPVLKNPMKSPLKAFQTPQEGPGTRASVEDLLNRFDEGQLEEHISFLSGESPQSNYVSRLSTHPDCRRASEWISGKFQSFGFSVETVVHDQTHAPNVIATLPGVGNPGEIVVVGAHLDSRGSQGNNGPAPGANDDGSGTAGIIEFARVISESGARFNYTLELHAYTGEEQGLRGSRFIANQYRQRNAPVVAMFNMDMIAYAATTEPYNMGIISRFTNPDLSAFATRVTRQYVDGIRVDPSTVCCSDQQSWFEQGYNAMMFFDRAGSINDPFYHNSGDRVYRNGYNFEKYGKVVKGCIASAAVFAEIL